MHSAHSSSILHTREKSLARLQDVGLFERTLKEINAIRDGGEAAILKVYAQKGIHRSTVHVGEEEVQEALVLTDEQDLAALQALRNRCQRLARLEKEATTPLLVLDDTDSFHSSMQLTPLKTVGIYVPDRMPSSLILYCSLAQEAGVEHIILALPPQKNGKIRPELLAAASFFPVHIIGVGGKSAFPALAFGLGGHIPGKLFGPCSFYVDYVKQILGTFYKIAVDLPAGPSELVIFADEEKDALQVEYDIRAQMEHGEDSFSFVISTNHSIIGQLRSALLDISSQVAYFQASSYEEAADLINCIAPEILEIFAARPDDITRRLENVANVYVNMTSTLGDYGLCGKGCCDPTYGEAAGMGGVTIESFLKGSCTSIGLQRSGKPEPWVTRLPALEQFHNHKRAIDAYYESQSIE
jgi:histidinol dehydrogenase